MTVEEKAEEGLNKRLGTYGYIRKQDCYKNYTDGFIDGYHECQKEHEWHDLRKDPKGLPDEGTYLVVWANNKGYKEIFIMNYEEDDEEELHWVDGDCEVQDEHIIAWCEIPTFDKE